MNPPRTCVGSLFEQPGYLRAAATALDAEIRVAESAGAMLPLLDCPDGILRTVPGLPRPYGSDLPRGLGELARELTEPDLRIAATLSPLQCGPELARQMSVRGARLAAERQICIASLEGGAPQSVFGEQARGLLERAVEHAAAAEVTAIDGWFAPFLRAAVELIGAPSSDDAYVAALSELDHYTVAVHDRAGLAAAAMFLYDGREAYLHLGGCRAEPAPDASIVAFTLAAGIDQARRSGCGVVVLGGGRTDRLDDPLLHAKLAFATASLPSFTVDVGLVVE